MSFTNIPTELRLYDAWCLWKYEEKENGEKTKVPYQLNGRKCSPTDPTHWASFESVVNYKQKLNGHSGFDGIGFCLSDFSPFSVIDLDYTEDKKQFERQQKIYENFNSYSEVSPSGKGLHIVVMGKVPSGRRREKVELYSSQRYICFTGQVYNPAPIAHRQELLNILWAEMGPEVPAYNLSAISQNQLYTDQEILKQGTNAVNGDKFCKLMNGDWSLLGYPSQSEADFALIDMFAFYSQNVEQIKRLWYMSALSKRNKQTSIKGVPYLDHMINRAFDRQLPYVDLSKITVNGVQTQEGATPGNKATPSHGTSEPQAQAMPGIGANIGEANTLSSAAAANLVGQALAVKLGLNTEDEVAKKWPLPKVFPPGLMGDIARYIMQQAPRPCFEIALVGAIGFMAGICGRAFNTEQGGLNYYIAVLAETASGKEAIKSGYDNIFAQLKPHIPQVESFEGPSRFRSGQSFNSYFQESSCFVSVLGEFGIWCKKLHSPRSTDNTDEIKQSVLDLYVKSGFNRKLGKSVYADKLKNSKNVASPSLTIVGESTASEFYSGLDETAISSGFLNRFCIIDYKGYRPVKNPNRNIKLPDRLLNDLKNLIAVCLAYNELNPPTYVEFLPECKEILDEIENRATTIINSKRGGIRKDLWGRADAKVQKLAALVAVGVNQYKPVVDKACIEWAYKVITHDIENLASKFDCGDIGEESKISYASDDNQMKEALRIIGCWIRKEELPKLDDKMLAAGIYTFSALQMRTAPIACFRKDKMGSTHAFKRVMQSLLDAGDIRELNSEQIKNEFGKRARCFQVVDYDRFV